MGCFLFLSSNDFIPDAMHNLITKVLREYSIGIDDDEGGSNECKYLIIFVAFNQII